MASRSLSRPSSAPSAKAFALRPFSLDLLALPFLFENYSFDIVVFFYPILLVKKNSTLPLLSRSYSVFKVPYEHASESSRLPKTLVGSASSLLPYRGLNACSEKALALRLAPSLTGLWWAQMDSNHRPRAYQARALTV